MPLIRIRDVGKSGTDTWYAGDYDSRYVVEPGSTLVGMDGDFRVAQWQGPKALLNQRVCKLTIRKGSEYDERFLLYVLPGYLKAIHDFTSSVTVKHLSLEDNRRAPNSGPAPPRAEADSGGD